MSWRTDPRARHCSAFLTALSLFLTGSTTLLWRTPQAVAQTAQRPKSQSIRVSVDRVNVGVIVTDSRGKFVEGLTRENFRVLDNGVEQTLTDFAAIEEPAQVLLLIESGPAVYLLEAGHLRAARALLDGLSTGDRLAVVKYAEAPQALLDFTPDKQAAAAALGGLQFNLGFGDLNLSSSLFAVLDWLPKTHGKKSIVLLSTGVDSSPENIVTATLDRLKIGDARVLAVSLSGPLRNPKPGGKMKVPEDKVALAAKQLAESDRLLTLIAEASGGRAYFPINAKEFSAAYTQIAQLVRHEYSLAFAPTVLDGKVHSIEVRVTTTPATASASPTTQTPAYRIDYRRAYLAPAP
jgi:VWFA-related protein